MGLRRQAREIAQDPVDTRLLPVRITGTGRIASAGGGETVQPGTKFVPNPWYDRRDIFLPTVGGRIPSRSPEEPSITIIPKLVGSTNNPSPVASAPVVRRSPVPQKEPAIPIIQSKVPKMGLDLGNLISTGLDLYRTYEDIRRGPAPRVAAGPAAPVVAPTPVAQTYWPGAGYGVEQMAGPTFIDSAPGGGLPGFDVISEPPTDDTKGWVYKKVCGQWKWVKPKRRRRRKLLTDSDYNGLLKLQTLKVNSNMNIAIAKSIGR